MELRKLLKLAKQQGWEVGKTKKNHTVFTGPDGQRVVSPSTPSDHRSMKNTVGELRRHGMEVPR